MGKVLILGGTRNLGHVTAVRLLSAGHHVTVLNRGLTVDELPVEVERIHADRKDTRAIREIVRGRVWDAVVDTTSFTGADADEACTLFRDKCARIIFISTGQVYLVRREVRPPFRECDYDGPIIPEPSGNSSDHDNWRYGVEKRNAEEVFSRAAGRGLAVASLRLPMIASERDHYGRIQGYIARVQDGGPIVVPDDTPLPIRHVYVEDAARVIDMLCADSWTGYKALNISLGESASLEEFLFELTHHLGATPHLIRVGRQLLDSVGLLPACSPYSGKWMSELDNSLSVRTFGASLEYTPLKQYLPLIISDYETRWRRRALDIPGYDRREEEINVAKKHG